jgi:hypothetical protein
MKSITISAQRRIDIICHLQFGGCSSSELTTLDAILSHSNNGSCCLDANTSNTIKSSINQNDSLFRTNIHRLHKKGVIKKAGRTIYVHPLLNENLDKLLIQFSPD